MKAPGMVLGVDRDYVDVNGTRTGQVRALLQSGEEIEACYAGEPPWPLATALFEGPGEWFCLGPIGDRRVLVHDDFLFYGASSIGDTEWIDGGTGASSNLDDPVDGAGVVRLAPTTGSDRYYIRKRDRVITLSDSQPVWFTARVRPNDAAVDMQIGLADANVITNGGVGAGTDSAVYANLSVSFGDCDLFTGSGASGTSTLTGEPAVEDAWVWVDLLVLGGQWAALWMNGSGPWVSTSHVPSPSTRSVSPFVAAISASGAVTADVDLVAVSLVSPVNTPDDVAIPAVPFAAGGGS